MTQVSGSQTLLFEHMLYVTCLCKKPKRLTYSITYLLTPRSRVFEKLTGSQLVRNSPHFTEPEVSLPHSQVPATGPYTDPDRSIYLYLTNSRLTIWVFGKRILFYDEELLAPRPIPNLEDHPCRLSATAYSVHSQLPSILQAVPPSANWGSAMPWLQWPTYRGLQISNHFQSNTHIVHFLNPKFTQICSRWTETWPTCYGINILSNAKEQRGYLKSQ
jgi:hypothetical protein